MRTELESTRSRPPVLRRAVAGLVLIAAAALVLKLAIGLVVTVFYVALGAVVVLAILWALKTLVW